MLGLRRIKVFYCKNALPRRGLQAHFLTFIIPISSRDWAERLKKRIADIHVLLGDLQTVSRRP